MPENEDQNNSECGHFSRSYQQQFCLHKLQDEKLLYTKNLSLINNGNLKEDHMSINKLHLNRDGNSVLTKNLLNFIEGY